MSQIANHIIIDISETLIYLPAGCAIALPILIGHMIWSHMHKQKVVYSRLAIEYIFFVYIIAALSIAFWSRESGSRDKLALIPLATWGTTASAHAYVVENVIMFLPFGILLPIIWKKAKSFRWCMVTAFAVSLLLELMQVVTMRGYGQTDDVIMNGLGAAIGYGIFYCTKKIIDIT